MKAAMVAVIQTAWETGAVPKDWTVAKLIAIPKKTAAVEWSDHRGITLLVTASKVLTRLIMQRLTAIPVGEWQFGFRREGIR